MTQLSKLQIRAKVLSVISEIKSLQYKNEDALNRLSNELEEIDDKEAMFDIFLKEYLKLEEEEYSFCACLIKNMVPADYVTEKSMEQLKSSISDELKYKIVQLLRITGGDYNYAELPNYFENPQEVMDLETKRLLDSAVFNPEAMLDFLDFVSAVSEHDRSLLLKSLNIDYSGDELANIVYPVLFSDFDDEFILQAIDVLIESKSSLAIAPFEFLIETSDNEQIVNSAKTGLKKLKLAGAAKEKADEYFKNIIKTSKPAQYFVTIPDGSGKQALLTTRKHNDAKYSLCAIVISDLIGIVDCFGFFSISQEEVIKVINKFCNAEGHYVSSHEYVKSRINFAHSLNIKQKRSFPYEYICWSPMIKDIDPLSGELLYYIETDCKKCEIKRTDVVDIMSCEYTLRWFITPNDSIFVKKITDDIYNFDKFEVDDVNQMLKENLNNVFTEDFINIWKNRFYNLIYILCENGKNKEADIFYTILTDDNYFELFKQIILQRSIFNHFVAIRENKKDSFFTTNIFKKRNSSEKNLDIKKLNNIIETLKRGWLER